MDSVSSFARALALISCLLALTLHQATQAAWNEQFAISSLASGGTVLFITQSGNNLVLKKGSVIVYEQSQPPVVSQSFTGGPGWPNGVFTLKVNSKYLNNNGAGVLQLKTVASASSSWTYDSFGRLVSSLDGSCVGVASAVSGGLLSLSGCSTASVQQWLFSPSSTPPISVTEVDGTVQYVTFDGSLSLLDESYPQRMCLEGPPQILLPDALTLLTAPTLKPCDSSNGQQRLQSLSSSTPDDNYPNGIFKLYFPVAQLCITLLDPALGAGLGRKPVILALGNCSNNAETNGFFNRWLWNSRGQAQSELMVDGATGATLPVCLSATGQYSTANTVDNITASDCSMYTLKNRWLFSSSLW